MTNTATIVMGVLGCDMNSELERLHPHHHLQPCATVTGVNVLKGRFDTTRSCIVSMVVKHKDMFNVLLATLHMHYTVNCVFILSSFRQCQKHSKCRKHNKRLRHQKWMDHMEILSQAYLSSLPCQRHTRFHADNVSIINHRRYQHLTVASTFANRKRLIANFANSLQDVDVVPNFIDSTWLEQTLLQVQRATNGATNGGTFNLVIPSVVTIDGTDGKHYTNRHRYLDVLQQSSSPTSQTRQTPSASACQQSPAPPSPSPPSPSSS